MVLQLHLWELVFTSGLEELLAKSLAIILATVGCTQQSGCISVTALTIRISSLVLLTPQVLNFWVILVSVIRTQFTVVPDCVLLSTMGWEIREKFYNELLSPSSIELEFPGESSLSLSWLLICASQSCIIGDVHCALFTVITKHLLQMKQPLNDSLTFWFASYLQMEIEPLKRDVYYLLHNALVANSLLTTFVLWILNSILNFILRCRLP